LARKVHSAESEYTSAKSAHEASRDSKSCLDFWLPKRMVLDPLAGLLADRLSFCMA